MSECPLCTVPQIEKSTFINDKYKPRNGIVYPVYWDVLLYGEHARSLDDYVICELCGGKFGFISYGHLKYKHNMTCLEYKNKFPDADLISLAVKRVSCINSSKVIPNPWNIGLTKETDTRVKNNAAAIQLVISEQYRNGRKAWNYGETKGTDPRILKNAINIGLATKGKPKSPEHIRKYRESLINGFKNGRVIWDKGKTFKPILSDEQRKKRSENFSGNKNPNWNGGSSFGEYGSMFPEQRKITLVRDNYICKICGNSGNNVHHIDYNKNNNILNNLVCLCKKCHSKTNRNRLYWTDYFRSCLN